MKKTIQSAFLAFVLLAVSFSGCTPALTPTIVPTTVPSTITPSPIPSTFTPEPPAIDESVKGVIGEEEYGEITTGKVKGKDYVNEKDFDGTVEASSVEAANYHDSNFSYVVTGEATDSSGNKFTVVWNEEGNYWFKNENVDSNLKSPNRTNFGKQLPGMIENRDLYRMLLTQMDTSFPENTETARFWMVPRNKGVVGIYEFFYTLDLSRADNSDDGVAQYNAQGVDQPDYQDIRRGGFTKGNEPYRVLAMIDGISPAWTDKQNNHIDGREISVIPVLVQNSDGKTMIWFAGMDATQRDDILTGKIIDDGNNIIVGNDVIPKNKFEGNLSAKDNSGIENLLIQHIKRLNLVIPPADEALWDNYEKAGGNNGGVHYRDGNLNFADDAIIAMQDEPGVFFNLLPADMQQKLDNALTEVKDGGWQVFHAVPFEGNALPQNVIDYLSNHIFETYYDSNPWSQ